MARGTLDLHGDPGAQTMVHFAAPDEVTVKAGTPALCLVSEDVDARPRSWKRWAWR